MKVLIDGVEYVPKVEIGKITDEKINECLMVLTEMRYHNQNHKMKALAWDAINSLSPDLANLSEKEAYDFVHKDDQV